MLSLCLATPWAFLSCMRGENWGGKGKEGAAVPRPILLTKISLETERAVFFVDGESINLYFSRQNLLVYFWIIKTRYIKSDLLPQLEFRMIGFKQSYLKHCFVTRWTFLGARTITRRWKGLDLSTNKPWTSTSSENDAKIYNSGPPDAGCLGQSQYMFNESVMHIK